MFDFDEGDEITPLIIAELHQRFSVILRIINCREVIDVRAFREYEIQTNLLLIENFKWMGFNFIGHGWQAILRNGSKGLAQIANKALEGAHQVNNIIHLIFVGFVTFCSVLSFSSTLIPIPK